MAYAQWRVKVFKVDWRIGKIGKIWIFAGLVMAWIID
jgi:hypothetical protein